MPGMMSSYTPPPPEEEEYEAGTAMGKTGTKKVMAKKPKETGSKGAAMKGTFKGGGGGDADSRSDAALRLVRRQAGTGQISYWDKE